VYNFIVLKLFNTLTKKKEEFVPIKKGKVSMYTCGPTVYGRPHIGNYSSFLMADLLRRWLEVSGFKVTHVKNITDVGHLTADAEADAGGEDKIEKKAKAEKGEKGGASEALTADDVLAVAKRYENEYLEDEKELNMVEPQHRPRATETINEMIEIIKKLVDGGYAYETEDGVYFSVERFKDYGKLSGNTLANLGKLLANAREEVANLPAGRQAGFEKKHPADFALWKKRVGENKDHVLHWETPWGDGFPGWHIECSAMSTKFLGEQIDVHTGGEDNIFPHHECEIAQSEAASGKKFVNYWLHKRRVNFGDEKMSKSLGNVLSLPEIKEKGFSALDLRYLFLSSHYRSHTQFTWKGLEDAKKARLRIVEWAEEMLSQDPAAESFSADSGEAGEEQTKDFQEKFVEAMNDDMNTPEALAVVFELMSASRKNEQLTMNNEQLRKFVEMLEKTFGCFKPESFDVPADILKLVEDREKARREGDYALSDKLRDEVKAKGFVVEDVDGGPKVVPTERRF
jgi:cysteinyl-tRNA synthetase